MQNRDVLLRAANTFQRWRVPLLAMAAVILGAKLWLISAFANPTPYWDQWDREANALFKPYIEGTLRMGDLLAPHNEHRILWSQLVDIVLLELNGRWQPVIEMTGNALLHVAAIVALVAMLGATLGRTERVILALTTAILLALPFGWENTLWGFQSPFYFVILFSLACFHYGVDAPAFSVRWWGAMALGVGAYFALASGALTLVPLITVHGLQTVVRRRSGWREYAAIALAIAIVVLMLRAIPTLDHRLPLRAHSVLQFASAFFVAMAWPLSQVAQLQPQASWDFLLNLAAAVLVNIPFLAFAWNRVRRLSTADRTVWVYLLVGLWTTVQAASLAYGRANSMLLVSRNLDLLIINIILNVACLLNLVHVNVACRLRRAAAAWAMATVVVVMILSLVRLPREVLNRWHVTQQQAINTSAFLATGDLAHLTDKPYATIPYWSAERLGKFASDPTIRSILPEDIMPAAEAHTRNSKLLLGGPLYSLFHEVRRVLMLLGLFCLTAGSLVFVCVGCILKCGHPHQMTPILPQGGLRARSATEGQ